MLLSRLRLLLRLPSLMLPALLSTLLRLSPALLLTLLRLSPTLPLRLPASNRFSGH